MQIIAALITATISLITTSNVQESAHDILEAHVEEFDNGEAALDYLKCEIVVAYEPVDSLGSFVGFHRFDYVFPEVFGDGIAEIIGDSFSPSQVAQELYQTAIDEGLDGYRCNEKLVINSNELRFVADASDYQAAAYRGEVDPEADYRADYIAGLEILRADENGTALVDLVACSHIIARDRQPTFYPLPSSVAVDWGTIEARRQFIPLVNDQTLGGLKYLRIFAQDELANFRAQIVRAEMPDLGIERCEQVWDEHADSYY